MMRQKRYLVLDLLRGFLLLNMIAYHFLYDWVYLFQQSCPFMYTTGAYLWQQAICCGFILLAGCCCTLSRHPAKRGISIFLCGLLVTAVTWLVTPQERILFGILHFIGLAYLITALLQPLLAKIPRTTLLLLSLFLFVWTRGIYYGYLGILQYKLMTLPDLLYQCPLLFPIGLPDSSFSSSDYFPLIPWLFLFWVGYAAGPALRNNKVFQRIQHWQLPILNWIGRNTLPLYLLHQPVLFLSLSLMF